MQQIIFFFLRNKNFLLFAALFIISIRLTIQSHSFHSSKFTSSANFLSGGVYSAKNNITGYFGLKEENQTLIDENKNLRTLLSNQEYLSETTQDTSSTISKFNYISAKVINNTYSKTKNLLTLEKGFKDGIEIDMGVITSNGIVGIVNKVSKNYATVQSILNTNSQINARLKNSNHFGSLVWNTKNPNIVQLTDVNRLAPVKIGDSIVTDGKSTIFPLGIPIGAISAFELGENDSYNLDILLFNDMTNLKHVYIIENNEAEEIKTLEKGGADEQ